MHVLLCLVWQLFVLVTFSVFVSIGQHCRILHLHIMEQYNDDDNNIMQS